METSEIYDSKGKIIPRECEGAEAIAFLNSVIWNTEIRDFWVTSYDGDTLLITGSFDQCYYHEIEVRFTGVDYISIQSMFTDPKFEMFEGRPTFPIPPGLDLSGSTKCFRVQDPTEFEEYDFLIVAEQITVKTGLVYHASQQTNGSEQDEDTNPPPVRS